MPLTVERKKNYVRKKTLSALVVFLFKAELGFEGAIINGPNFNQKFAFGGPKYKLQASCCFSCTGPKQDSVKLVKPL